MKLISVIMMALSFQLFAAEKNLKNFVKDWPAIEVLNSGKMAFHDLKTQLNNNDHVSCKILKIDNVRTEKKGAQSIASVHLEIECLMADSTKRIALVDVSGPARFDTYSGGSAMIPPVGKSASENAIDALADVVKIFSVLAKFEYVEIVATKTKTSYSRTPAAR